MSYSHGAIMQKIKWEQQERGWWTHPKLGGIVKEEDNKWHCYSNVYIIHETPNHISNTFTEAIKWMEQHIKNKNE